MIESEGYDNVEQIMEYVNTAREMFDHGGTVPPLRKFAKNTGKTTKELYDIFHKGPMKLICKWGALPKPTGCV